MGHHVVVMNNIAVIVGMLDIERGTLVNNSRIVDFLLRRGLEIDELRAEYLGEEGVKFETGHDSEGLSVFLPYIKDIETDDRLSL